MPSRSRSGLPATPAEREQLLSYTRSRSLPRPLVTRAWIILRAADGATKAVIAAALGLTRPTVGVWRQRYLRQRLQGLYDELRLGGPRTIRDEQIALLLRRTLKTKPKGGTHWTRRVLAAETRISKSTVQRVWRAFGLQPHRQKHFKLSTDPFFAEKVRDIAGLYLDPPNHALVLCVDEKSQIQALERTQRLLPLGLGYVEGVTHYYFRHGTTTLFAPLDLASGRVLTQCQPRHRHQEFLRFLRHIEAAVPPDLAVHLVVDNYGTHKHAKVRRWLAARPRFQVHYTPTYASWLNQVEICFSNITQRAMRRGTFRTVPDLVAKIDTFVQHYNRPSHPFVWTARPTRSSPRSSDFVKPSPGQDTRAPLAFRMSFVERLGRKTHQEFRSPIATSRQNHLQILTWDGLVGSATPGSSPSQATG